MVVDKLLVGDLVVDGVDVGARTLSCVVITESSSPDKSLISGSTVDIKFAGEIGFRMDGSPSSLTSTEEAGADVVSWFASCFESLKSAPHSV